MHIVDDGYSIHKRELLARATDSCFVNNMYFNYVSCDFDCYNVMVDPQLYKQLLQAEWCLVRSPLVFCNYHCFSLCRI